MVFELFSQRNKRRDQEAEEELYQYENVSSKLRVQIQQILTDSIGPQFIPSGYGSNRQYHNPDAWRYLTKTLRKEFGVHELYPASTERSELLDFLGQATAEKFVDAIELCVRFIALFLAEKPQYQRDQLGIVQDPLEAIDEINYRFRQATFGYQFEEGHAFRIDSTFHHDELIKPALRILRGQGYEGARDEFLDAHKHYRNGDYEEAISEAAKAFESVLKITCDANHWAY